MKSIFKKSSLLFCLWSFFFVAQAQAATFEWETATDNGASIEETISTITATVTNSDGDVGVVNAGDIDGTSGNIIFSDEGSETSYTFSFSASVDITTIRIYPQVNSSQTWTFTPTGGSNSNVNIVISSTTSSLENLNWTDVDSFTVTSSLGTDSFAFDEMNFTVTPTDPTIDTATYNASTGNLVVTGTNYSATGGALNDVDASLFTFTGEGGSTYTLTDTSDAEISSATEFTLILSATDRAAVNQIINKNGTSSTGGTNYDLDGAAGFIVANSGASDTGTNPITASSVAAPTISLATYNHSTGVLVVTGTNLVKSAGATNDVDASLFTFTGEAGGTYTLTDTNDVEITDGTTFTLTLSATDKVAVNGLLNKDGLSADNGTTYNLAAADNWMTGSDTALNIADLTGNGITVSSHANPTITSATYNATTGTFAVTGTRFVRNAGALNDVDISLFTITGEGGGGSAYTITSATDVEITNETTFSFTVGGADKTGVDTVINLNGTQSQDATLYNLAAADNWMAAGAPSQNIADTTGNGITASNVNSSPVFTGLDGTPSYTENGSAQILDTDVTITDAELDALNAANGDYSGASLTIARNGGASANDVLSFDTGGGAFFTVSGSNLQSGGLTFATFTSAGGTLTVNFTSSATTATSALVDNVLQRVNYANGSEDPATSVQLNWSFSDGNTADTGSTTVSITAVNDEPSLTADTFTPTFTEGGSWVVTHNNFLFSDQESNAFNGMTITVTNVQDGANEELELVGSFETVPLVHGASGSFFIPDDPAYQVSVVGSTATITITPPLSIIEIAALEFSYRNLSNDPTPGSRVITITEVKDNGGTANGGDDTTSLSIASTVTVVGVNDEPTLTATGNDPTFTEGGSAADAFSTVTASTIESGQTIQALTLTVTNVNDGSNEILNVDGTAIALTNANSGTTATNSLSYAVSVVGSTATVSLTGGTMSTAATQTLVDGMSYQNNSNTPNTSNRVITITSMQDSGGTANGGDNTVALAITSTVTVVETNDEPTLAATALNPTVYVNDPAANLFNTASASTIEGGQNITGFIVEIRNQSPVFIELYTGEFLGIDGSSLELLNGTGTTANNGFSYTSGQVFADRQRFIFSGGSVSAAVFQDIVNNMTYRNTNNSTNLDPRTARITTVTDSGSGTPPNDNENTGISLSSSITVLPLPTISNLVATPTNTSATITWDTNVLASTQVHSGVAGNALTPGAVTDTAPRVTSHSVNLTGLLACTTYEYKVTSEDSAAHSVDSATTSFTTTGCGATVNSFGTSGGVIPNGAPTAFAFGVAGDRVTLTPSANYSATCDAIFHVLDLEESEIIAGTGGGPTGNNPGRSYEFAAYCDDNTTQLTTFDNPITVTIEYPDAAVAGINESSLAIYRWNGAAWEELNNCVVDAGTNTLTCETTNFSPFGMFGSPLVSGGGGGAPTNHTVNMCSYETKKCTSVMPYERSTGYDEYRLCVRNGGKGTDCALTWAQTNGYVTPDEYYANPNAAPVVQEVAPLTSTEPSEESTFSDVFGNTPNAAAIEWMAAEGIVQGYDDGTFKPAKAINRVEFLKIILEATGKEEAAVCRRLFSYSDVEWDSWYGNYIQKASCEGIVKGYPDQSFKPGNTINFVEAAKVAVEALGMSVEEGSGQWFEPYVDMLREKSAIPSSISDNGQALTRGEMAYIIWKLMQ